MKLFYPPAEPELIDLSDMDGDDGERGQDCPRCGGLGLEPDGWDCEYCGGDGKVGL